MHQFQIKFIQFSSSDIESKRSGVTDKRFIRCNENYDSNEHIRSGDDPCDIYILYIKNSRNISWPVSFNYRKEQCYHLENSKNIRNKKFIWNFNPLSAIKRFVKEEFYQNTIQVCAKCSAGKIISLII